MDATYPRPGRLNLSGSMSERLGNAIECVETALDEVQAETDEVGITAISPRLLTIGEHLDEAMEELTALEVLITPIPLHKPAAGREYFGPRSFSLITLLVVVLWIASIFRGNAAIDYLNTQVDITNAQAELTRMKLRATSREVDRVEILCRGIIQRGGR